MDSSARIDDLQQKFAENPRRFFAPLANEYRKAGDARRAAEICREHLAHQPGHMSGHIVLGQALYDVGSAEEARRVFGHALALDPENLVALRYLGDLSRDVGEPEAAREWYRRALAADPLNPEVGARMADLDASVLAEGARFDETPPSPPDRMHQPRPAPAIGALWSPMLPGADDLARTVLTGEGSDVTGALSALGSLLPSETDRELLAEEEGADFTAGFFAAVLDDDQPAAAAPPEHAPSTRDDAERDDAEPADAAEHRDAAASAPVPAESRAEADVRDVAPELPEGRDARDADDATDAHEPFDSRGDTAGAAAGDERSDAPGAAFPIWDWADQTSASSEAADGVEAARDGQSSAEIPDAAEDPVADGGVRVESDAFWQAGAGTPDVDDTAAGAAAPTGERDEAAEELDAAANMPDAPAAEGEPSGEERDAPAAEAAVPTPAAPASMDAGETEPEGGGDGTPDIAEEPLRGPLVAFVTETMAELYLQQGFRSEAIAVYHQLVVQYPDDAELRARADRLAGDRPEGDAADGAEAVPSAHGAADERADAGPTVAAWLQELISAAPPAPAPGPDSGGAPPESRASRAGPSLDDLFAQPVGSAEEFAAGALVATTLSFQDDPAVNAQLAEASAEDPASLDRVLRPTPRSVAALRGGASFSFDQFFRDDAASASAVREPAAGSATSQAGAQSDADDDAPASDLEEFHAWLAGLSRS